MRRLRADERWGLPCIGYHIQARPDRDSTANLQRLQQDTARTSPVALNLIPADALHLSVATLVAAQSFSDDGELQWFQIEGDVRRKLAAVPTRKEFSILFPSLAFTKKAVIVLTRDQPAALREAREGFGEVLTSFGMERPQYDQAHITIARYAESAALDEAALSSIERDDLAVVVGFHPFRLVRERRYPSLQIETI